MNPIIKPWPFRGWRIDIIGQIYPLSSKGHKFVVVATNYFTKWVEAVPLKMVMSQNMIDFVQEHIIYQFGIPRTITTDQGAMFISEEFESFATGTGFKLLNTLENIEANKLRIAEYYDKKVKTKVFHEGGLVWKLILPIGTKDGAYDKWSPT
jgi:hypothetical protein